MALRIPGAPLPQVDPQTAPTVRVRPSMDASNFGGGRAVDGAFNQARGLAGDVSEIAFREEMRALEAQKNKASTLLGKAEYDGRAALYAVQGEGALEAQGKMLQDFDKSAEEILKGVTSQRARSEMATDIERRRIALEGTTKGYVRGELLKFEEEKAFSKVQSEGDNAIQSMDPLRVAMALDEQHNTLKKYAALSGKPKEWLDVQSAKEASRVHRGVISQYLAAGDDITAKNYFEANKGEILNSASVADDVKSGSYLGSSQREEDRIASSGKSEEEMLRDARGIKDERLRDLVIDRLEKRWSQDKRAAAAAYSGKLDDYVKRIVEKWTPSNGPATATVQDVIGPEWGRLKSADQGALKKLFNQVNGHEVAETDPAAYTRLYGMDQGQLASFSDGALLREFGTKLSPQDYQEAVKLWKKAKEEPAEVYRGGLKDRDAILDAMKGTGLGALSKDDTFLSASDDKRKAKEITRFMGLVSREEAAWTRRTGKPPKPEEYRAMVENVALNESRTVTLKRYDMGVDDLDSDETRRIFNLTEDELNEEEIDIPKDWKNILFNLAKSEGGIDQRVSVDDFERQYRPRLNRAYVQAHRAKTGNDIDWDAMKRILSGK